MKIKFEIKGIPVPKGRPRFARHGVFISTRTPAKTKNWEEFVKHQAYSYAPDHLPGCALGMVIKFRMPRPKTLPKKYKRMKKKPDIENLAKSVLDALEGLFYKNDSQVDELHISKCYASPGEGAGVSVALEYGDNVGTSGRVSY